MNIKGEERKRYRRTQLPQRSFSSFRHRARSWPRQRRICYKAEHTATGTNLRFVITNCAGRASQVFAFYNDRGECENRIEEFKNGFRADRLSCHRFLANAFRLLLHAAAYNLVNFFRLQLPQPWRSAQIETLRAQLFKIGARVRHTARCIASISPAAGPFRTCSAPPRSRQQQLTSFLTSQLNAQSRFLRAVLKILSLSSRPRTLPHPAHDLDDSASINARSLILANKSQFW